MHNSNILSYTTARVGHHSRNMCCEAKVHENVVF